MPPCKNDSEKYYTGKEPSPRGLGYVASSESVGKQMQGKDGRKWQVHADKNGKKSWKLKSKKKTTQRSLKSVISLALEKFYDIPIIKPSKIKNLIATHPVLLTMYNDVRPVIENESIPVYIVPLPLSSNDIYWSDFSNSYLKQYYDENYQDSSFILITIYLHKNLDINLNKPPMIQYSLMLDQQQFVMDKFIDFLPYNYCWDGNDKSCMYLFYEKRKTKCKKITIQEQSDYPMIVVEAGLKIKPTQSLIKLGGYLESREFKNFEKFDKYCKFIDDEYSSNYFNLTFFGVKSEFIKEIVRFMKTVKKKGVLTFKKDVLTIKEFDLKIIKTPES